MLIKENLVVGFLLYIPFSFSFQKLHCCNSRTSLLEELTHRSAQQLGNGKLPRVSSSPSLKQAGSPLQINNSGQTRMELMSTNLGRPITNSNESLLEPSGETGPKTPTELNSTRKRKTTLQEETKEDAPANGNMVRIIIKSK